MEPVTSPTVTIIRVNLEENAMVSLAPIVQEHVKLKNFNLIEEYLNTSPAFPKPSVKNVLIACNEELCQEKLPSSSILNIIYKISTDYIVKYDNVCDEELQQSAVKVIDILKKNIIMKIGLSRKPSNLTKDALRILVSYPEKILIKIATNHAQDILYIADKYFNDKIIDAHVNDMFIDLLMKLMKTMTPNQKREFVKDGLAVWFYRLIPLLMEHIAFSSHCIPSFITLTETLTEELIHIDYSSHPSWKALLAYLYEIDKYPALIKTALIKGNPCWYRVWNLFVRLLKTQITSNRPGGGSPINSLLTVVEAAFKMHIEDRCRAFTCWNVLIDNFSQETSESLVKKRIKLLVIPLISNNSKVEETALAKFHTWWYLITKFNTKLEQHADTVLIPFLHFCFGKNVDKSFVATPGMMYGSIKKLSVQAFSEIVGHRPHCHGCNMNFSPKLGGRLLNTQMLVNFLPDWMYALQSSIKLTFCENPLDEAEQIIFCLWHSFIALLASLPDNNLRKDLVSQQFLVLHTLSTERKTISGQLAGILFKLILHPVDNDNKTKSILKCSENDIESSPIGILFNLLRNPFHSFYSRNFHSDPFLSEPILKPFINLALDSMVNDPDLIVKYMLNKLTNEEYDLVLWESILESVSSSKYIFKLNTMIDLLTWPIKNTSSSNFIGHCQRIWESFFTSSICKFQEPSFYHAVFLALRSEYNNGLHSKGFIVFLLLFILKNALESGEKNYILFEEELRFITSMVANIGTKENLINAFDLFVDFLPTMLNKIILCQSPIIFFTTTVLSAINVILKSISNSSDIPLSKRELLIDGILSSVDKLFELERFRELNSTLFDILIMFAKYNSVWKPINKTAKSILEKCSNFDPSNVTLKEALEDLNSVAKITKHVSPNSTKKSKEPKVSKQIVNGEEFVVVKSNWKFNPRKLTDHQKEVLQRKRDDIPALYQDLSQSQDDCKLISWKAPDADSQTTTLSNSKSPPKETNNFSLIINNLPTAEIVPTMLGNLKTDLQDKQETLKSNCNHVDAVMKKNDHTPSIKIPQETTPSRLSLKDRIFHNMKSLARSSAQTVENLNNSNDVNKNIEIPETQYPETPKSQNTNNKMVNSAPTLTVTERPTRVKRKPKKFDTDFQEIPVVKKSRNSLMFSDKYSNTESNAAKKRVANDTFTLDKQLNEDEGSVIVTEKGPTELNDIEVISRNDTGKQENSCVKLTDKDPMKLNDRQVISPNDEGKQENSCVIVTEENQIELNDIQVISSNVKDEQENTCVIITEKDPAKLNDRRIISPNVENKQENSCIIVTEKHSDELNDIQVISTNDKDEQENNCVIIAENCPMKLNEGQVISLSDECKQDNSCTIIIEKDGVELNDTTVISTNDEDKPVNSIISNQNDIISLDESDSISQSVDEKERIDLHKFDQPVDKETSIGNSDNSIEHFEPSTNKVSATKGSKVRKSRLEKELAIDMVEGHPYLSIPQSEKRAKRKPANEFSTKMRKSGSKEPTQSQSKLKQERITKMMINNDESKTDEDSIKEKESPLAEVNERKDVCNMPQSEDFIESSQDSIVSVMSTKTPKRQVRKQAQNALELIKSLKKPRKSRDNKNVSINEMKLKEKTKNNFQEDEIANMDVTANMDTQPTNSSPVNTIGTDTSHEDITKTKYTIITESQKVATADTQLVDQSMCKQDKIENKTSQNSLDLVEEMSPKHIASSSQDGSPNNTIPVTAENVSRSSLSSPFKDDLERNKDFLNNTFDISPIKMSSPVDDRCKTPSPENSQDYVVITLTSPVQSNGEPIDHSGTPEKTSPDKRDQSPVRESAVLTNNSPSSSLSLKRNRPQAKSRAAQMLGCVLGTANNVEPIISSEKGANSDESKQSPVKKSARRNLKNSYEDKEDSDMFLKFKRKLPAADSSPSCPILKRKHVHIVDETSISPASKRKRVSFHDPPVSTTMAVHKYIDPASQRSKCKLANDTPLIPSLSDINESDGTPDDLDVGSLEQTPQVDIVKTSDLDDTDSIYPNLINCSDPISNIALELSSPAMKSLLIEELQGKVETVGDLAKLTELEVNRLCIKAPKVVVVKKVLANYAKKIGTNTGCGVNANDTKVATVDAEIQTEAVSLKDANVQTNDLVKLDANVQTVMKPVLNTHVQTEEIKEKPLEQIIKASIDNPDFIEVLEKLLDKDNKMKIAASLSMDNMTEVLDKKLLSDSRHILDFALKRQKPDDNDANATFEENQSLCILREYICDNFSPSELVKFCSKLLNNIHTYM